MGRRLTGIRDTIRAEAIGLGFDACRFGPASLPDDVAAGLTAYLDAGHHGTMEWLAERAAQRRDPKMLWPDAQSVIALAMNYGPDTDPLIELDHKDRGVLSVYARNEDYHDVVKKRLKQLARWMTSEFGGELKVFVDTAPVMEKPLAAQAGVGWQGKHTNLVSREFGSWLFLGVIYTTLEIEADAPETDHCGSCRACLDICPTDAFPAPYKIDAQRCISYLTIEHKGPIDEEFRRPMGNRIYGCDDCLAVCPWNKFAAPAREAKLVARDELNTPKLSDLAALDDPAFRALFRKSPIKRIGRDRFIRNVMIAIGNSGDRDLLASLKPRLADENALVRGMAAWAWGELKGAPAALDQRRSVETDPDVQDELRAALAGLSPKT